MVASDFEGCPLFFSHLLGSTLSLFDRHGAEATRTAEGHSNHSSGGWQRVRFARCGVAKRIIACLNFGLHIVIANIIWAVFSVRIGIFLPGHVVQLAVKPVVRVTRAHARTIRHLWALAGSLRHGSSR